MRARPGGARSAPRAAAVAAAVALGVAPAQALAGPFADGATIASASLARLEQGDDATLAVALSHDARYVVFDTRATNFYPDGDVDPPGATRAGGIFRRDTISGALEKVADGDLRSDADGALLRRGAHAPSVSADGRFVAFSTAQRLVAADVNDNVDVYRRDMTIAPDRPGAYVLVSAKDGGDVPATYAPRPMPLPGRNPGTDLFAGRSISADGNRIAFRTVELDSDLPDHGAVDVPGGQLLVRDVAARATTLLTRRAGDRTPAGGAALPAVISADGSTVVWVGANAPAQTRFLAGEQLDPAVNFYLYRRLDDSLGTRRITGLADPDDAACDGSPVGFDPTATGPCYGPLSDTEQGRGDISQRAPALSADGRTVAFLAAAARRPTNVNNPGLDLFVTDMRPGVTRKAGTVELTREGDPADLRQSAQIESVSMSADGRWLAVATQRTRFVLPSLAPIGNPFRASSSARELYVVDRAQGTIERAVRGAGGVDADADVGSDAALSADGATLAFTSSASNLFFGDANQKADAFWVARLGDVRTAVPPPPPARGLPSFESDPEATGPRLRVSARRRTRDGALVLTIVAPAAGRLIVFARAGKPLRTVARAERSVGAGGRAVVVIRPRGRDLRRLRARRRLAASIRVRWTPKEAGARALSRLLQTRFEYRPPKRKRD